MPETPPLQNYTDLAVAIGGLVKGQEYMTKTVDEIRDGISGISQTVATHAILIAENRTLIDGHAKELDNLKPVKNTSAAIIATVIAGLAIVATILQMIWHT